MTGVLRARLLVGLGILVAAALLAGATTYLYGGQFQHKRYWEGTIPRVEDTEIGLVRNLLTRPGMPPLAESREDLEQMFEVLEFKLGVELHRDGQVVFTNRVEDWGIRGTPETVDLSDGAELRLYRYEPPSWNSTFLAWIKDPRKWLTRQQDRVTAPFVSFFLIYLVFLYALAWRHRARHLSDEVLAVLRQPPGGGA